MHPTAAHKANLGFLFDTQNMAVEVIAKFDCTDAKFDRTGLDGMLAVKCFNTHFSYQLGLLSRSQIFTFAGFRAGTEFLWDDRHDEKTKTTTLVRLPYIFERSLIKNNGTYKGQIAIRCEKDKQAKVIKDYVLNQTYLDKNQVACQVFDNARMFSKVDLCTATNVTTGKIHLFVLAPIEEGKFSVTSLSLKI